MSIFKKISGIIGGVLQLGIGGPKVSISGTDTILIKDKDSNPGILNVDKITGLSMPDEGTAAASKNYVDAVGIPKASCRLTTTTNHSLSGLADIDGETPEADERILVQGQSSPEDNGIYDASADAWARSDDADGTPEGEVVCGMHVFIREGTLHGGCSFILITEDPIEIGVTELVFTHFMDATGAVPKTLFDANTVLVANSDDTPIALEVAASRFLGRKSSGSIAAMTKAESLTELNVDDGADVTGSNAPQAHEASHKDSGSDEILLHELGEPTSAVPFSGQQATNFVYQNVADQAALDALVGVLGKVAFKVDTLDVWVCTSI